jgi:hypothetical protein
MFVCSECLCLNVRIKKEIPIGRYGEVEDIAACAVFLASPAGSFITSTTIVVGMGSFFIPAFIFCSYYLLVSFTFVFSFAFCFLWCSAQLIIRWRSMAQQESNVSLIERHRFDKTKSRKILEKS